MNDKKRFTLVVRECRVLANQLCIVGKPFGDYNVGDALYIRRTNVPVVKLDVEYTAPNDDLMEIYVKGVNFPENMKYAVVTDVEPQGAVDVNKPVENPFLMGLAREYRENFKEPEFINEFCYSLINAKFIVPVISEELGKKALDAEGKVKVNIGFHMITTKNDHKVLPVFSDWGSATEWKSFKEAPDRKTLILNFDQVTDISTRDADGFILNAFDMGVVVPKPFIDNIKSSDGYKNQGSVKATKLQSKTGSVQIGIPQDNEQVKLLKEAIVSFSENDKNIHSSYLFLKRGDGDISFLVVFDFDLSVTQSECEETFKQALKEFSPITGGRMSIEFAMKAPHFIKICNAYEPIYKE